MLHAAQERKHYKQQNWDKKVWEDHNQGHYLFLYGSFSENKDFITFTSGAQEVSDVATSQAILATLRYQSLV